MAKSSEITIKTKLRKAIRLWVYWKNGDKRTTAIGSICGDEHHRGSAKPMPVLLCIFQRSGQNCGAQSVLRVSFFGNIRSSRRESEIRLRGKHSAEAEENASCNWIFLLQACFDVFPTRATHREHEKLHKFPGGFPCSICDRIFLNGLECEQHTANDHEVFHR